MNGTKWPTWREGAVGSTPTYAPTRRSVSKWSRSSRVLDARQQFRSLSILLLLEPNDLVDKASLLQKTQHALLLSGFDRPGSLLPVFHRFFDPPDVNLRDPSPLLREWNLRREDRKPPLTREADMLGITKRVRDFSYAPRHEGQQNENSNQGKCFV
jgi:hypothetical protein